MLTHEQIDALNILCERAVEPVAEFLLDDIARRISRAGQFTSTAAYQVWKTQELGMSRKQIEKELKKRLGVSQKELERLLKQSAEVGYNFDISHLPTKAIPFSENGSLQQIISAAVALADKNFENITRTLGMVDPYGKAMPLKDVYNSCCDFAFNQVVTGAADYNTAIRRACKNLANQGLRTIDYESGVHTSLEAAVRRNIMGGLGLMQEQISEENHDKFSANGWEISAHAASAPDHEPIQGKQYSDKEYKALNNSLVRRIGTLNCGHSAFPIILGVSEPTYTDEQLEEFKRQNAEGVTYQGKHYTTYEATQKQRQIERAMRTQKRRVLTAEATGDEERLLTSQVKYRRLNEEYERFSKSVGLRTQTERMYVEGFSYKQGAKATKAAEKYYQSWSKSINLNKSIETLAKYYDVKYNDSPRYELLKGYAKAVDKGDISPLVGFDVYEKTSDEISRKIVGCSTSTGVQIESFAPHFVDRVIGQTSTPHKGMRCGVSVEHALDALQNPIEVGELRTHKDGDIRQTFYGKDAAVAISVRDKRLIQTNPQG